MSLFFSEVSLKAIGIFPNGLVELLKKVSRLLLRAKKIPGPTNSQ